MLPQGGLGWFSRVFENAEISKKHTSEHKRAITQSYGSPNRSSPHDEVNKYKDQLLIITFYPALMVFMFYLTL